MQSIFVVVQALAILWASGIAETRQIRINRYAASVQEDDLQQAEVRELKPTPYPAAGYRPEGRSFLLPGEDENVEGSDFNSDQATTTESSVDGSITSTTDALDLSTTTSLPTTTTSPLDTLESTTTTAPATVEFRSGRAFAKAPYPAAGYRPSRAFPLPTELNLHPDVDALQESTAASSASDSNANHPVCGVSTNPLMPTPEPGSKAEPDAESVVITANLGPAVLVARAPSSAVIPMAIPLRSQPLINSPRRGFVYTTRVEQRW